MLLKKPAHRLEHVSLEGQDPVELSTILSSSASKLTAKPATNEGIHFKCEFATAGALTIGLGRYEGKIAIEREGASDRYAIFVPRYGYATFKASDREVLTSPTQGVIVDCNQNSGITLSGPREHLVVVVDQASLCARLSDMLHDPVSGDLNFAPEIDLTAGPGMAIAQTAAALHSGLIGSGILRGAPLAQASLVDALMELVIELLPHRLSKELCRVASPMPRHVRRAIDFMKANLHESMTLHDIALAANVGTRTLQEGFKRFKMTTPMAYLQYLRLDAVHRDLTQAQPGRTVSDIAVTWGFTHLSRFAAEYRRRFGESPSETLRSSRWR